MEEYDDLAKGPDENGILNLSYSDFQTIPYEICNEYSKRLISLNLSYNNLAVISEQIGNLSLLKELNVSHNRLTTISAALGKCIRLRKLNLSHNDVTSVPIEIFQQCILLVRSECELKSKSIDVMLFCTFNIFSYQIHYSPFRIQLTLATMQSNQFLLKFVISTHLKFLMYETMNWNTYPQNFT